MKKEFKKWDLRTGMTVELRNGEKHLIFIGVDQPQSIAKDFMVSFNRQFVWCELEDYDDNLLYIDDSDHDVVKVFEFKHPYSFVNNDYRNTLLWERLNKQNETK